MNNITIFLAEKLIWIMGLGVVGLALFGQKKLAAGAGISAILAYLVGKFVKDFFFWPRPAGVELFDGSFPSNHTALAFGLAVFIYLKNKRTGLVMLFLAALVGVGRVMEGVHFPIDVIGGAVIGTVVAWLVDNYHSK